MKEDEGQSRTFVTLLEEVLREHEQILAGTNRLVDGIVREPTGPQVEKLLHYYDTVVRDHAILEEEVMVPAARREGVVLDGEALRFAHSTLHDAADSLRDSLEKNRKDRYAKEALELGRLLRDHFYEEENFLFVSDMDDIHRNSGSY